MGAGGGVGEAGNKRSDGYWRKKRGGLLDRFCLTQVETGAL